MSGALGLVVAIGAFFYWMLSGFKGSFDYYYSRSKRKNFITGLALIYGLGTMVYLILRYGFHLSLSDLQKPI
jgi:hypothetical protein